MRPASVDPRAPTRVRRPACADPRAPRERGPASVDPRAPARPCTHERELDPAIRDWVLLPIIVIMVLVTLARNAIQILITGDKTLSLDELRAQASLARAGRLRSAGAHVSGASFAMRREWFSRPERGVLLDKVAGGAAAANPMSSPNGAMACVHKARVYERMGGRGTDWQD